MPISVCLYSLCAVHTVSYIPVLHTEEDTRRCNTKFTKVQHVIFFRLNKSDASLFHYLPTLIWFSAQCEANDD